MIKDKMKAKVPYFIYSILEHDVKKFNIKLNTLLNIIFKRVIHEKNEFIYELFDKNVDFRKDFNKTISFKLKKENQRIFESEKNKYITAEGSDSIFLRSLLYTYINNPTNKREKFIYFDNYNKIKKSIKDKIKLSIIYKDKQRVIEPFFIMATEEERFNYLCCYCDTKKDIINYRLSNIHDILPLPNSNQIHRDEDKIEELKKDFDPYLSYNKFVKIKLTTLGKKYYKLFTYKPSIILLDGNNIKQKNTRDVQKTINSKLDRDGDDIFILEASVFKAKLFLGAFWEEVEVIEPLELKEWVKERAKKMNKMYNS